MEVLGWPEIVQIAAITVLLAALAELSLALISRVRRFRYERQAYSLALQTFEEQLSTVRIRRVDRERESASWSGYRKFSLARREDEGGGICSFYLEPHDGKTIPSYRPGQYLIFSLRIPGQRRPVVRCYSLSDAPDPEAYRVTIKKLAAPRDAPQAPPGTVSSFFHEKLEVGDILDVKAPVGDFFLDLSTPNPVVLVGGGVGLTPVLAILNAIAERGFDREVWLFYGVRDPDEHILKQHLNALARAQPEKFHLHVCYSAVEDAALPHEPPAHHHSGRASVDLFRRVLPSSNFDYYICGPPAMMADVTHELSVWGVPEDCVHFESFGPATVKKTPRAEQISGAASSSLKVHFARSGKELTWDPTAGSLLEFAEQHDVVIDSGCRAGSCGSCVTAIKDGEIAYLAEPGERPAAGSCLTCVSVPKTDLVLDA